jgi:hypothetical protein
MPGFLEIGVGGAPTVNSKLLNAIESHFRLTPPDALDAKYIFSKAMAKRAKLHF